MFHSNFKTSPYHFRKHVLLVLLAMTCCIDDPPGVHIEEYYVADYIFSELQKSTAFEDPLIKGQLTDFRFWEVSGIAASQANKGMLYTEEDSSNPTQMQMISYSGETKAIYSIEGSANRDWEDMAVAPGPQQGVSYIYLADIGDNKAQFSSKFIYRFPEPSLPESATLVTETIKAFDRIEVNFPDGAKNAESLLVDPVTKDIYIISKENEAVVYRASYPQDLKAINTMEKIATLPFTKMTGGDVSPDGNEVILKTTTYICYWKKKSNESMRDMFRTAPQLLPYVIEQQGEAVCFAWDGSGYFTLSERPDPTLDQPLYFYKRK